MILLAGIVSACASIMGVEEPILVEDERSTEADAGADASDPSNPGSDSGADSGIDGPVVRCEGPDCACGIDSDCEAAHPKCVDGKCVECTETNDVCPAKSYCKGTTCTPGCKSNTDCAAPTAFCDLNRRQCVECRPGLTDCADGVQCSPSGTCTPTCATDGGTPCTGGKTCCNGVCIDLKTDIGACGSCTNACATGETLCCNGQCTNPLTNTTRCGGCNLSCNDVVVNATGITCSNGACTYASCETGRGNCDGDRRNGCECSCGTDKAKCCPGDQCFGGLRCKNNGTCD